MQFAIGDHVLVPSLGKGVVRDVRKGGRCLVEIKGRTLLIDEQELSRVEGRKKAEPGHTPARANPDLPSGSPTSTSIDLHGMTTNEAVTALVDFVNDAILAGLPEVQVIHGRSGGRLKVAVHERLRALPTVCSFRLDPRNPGVTLVVL